MADFLSNPTTVIILMFALGFVFANMITKGFVVALLRVKLFKQGNVVVAVAHKIEDYYVPGNLEANALSFKARKRPDNKEPKRMITVPEGSDVFNKAKYRSWNCDVIQIDDTKNSIYIRENGSYISIGGFNAEAMAEKIDTALKKPPEDEVALMPPRQFQLIVILGIVLLGVGLYFVYKTLKAHDANTEMIYNEVIGLKGLMQNATISAKEVAATVRT